MNDNLLKATLEKEKIIRNKIKEGDENAIKNFSWVPFFAGEEFNQILATDQDIKNKANLIDFGQTENKNKEWLEKEIKRIYNNDNNKQLINNNDYPIIWFKNIEKISSDSQLEQSLLPIFDPQQNTKLFDDETNLSSFILIATSSTRDMGQLSLPLTSRLDCINVETAKPRQFFLDKYFTSILVGSVFLVIILGLLAFLPNRKKEQEEEK